MGEVVQRLRCASSCKKDSTKLRRHAVAWHLSKALWSCGWSYEQNMKIDSGNNDVKSVAM